MPRGRPPIEDVRKHFEKIIQADEFGRKTPRQKCNHCVVDLIERLKDHLMKCKGLTENLKKSLNFDTSKIQHDPLTFQYI
jgi:hypothetical protein